jgi:UDP-3-O-[3-hydroxymyristoyl] N-acetylglucosamine deacetylase/3-hydroxyacyl-[acyl-carrier-protein] dehydratase
LSRQKTIEREVELSGRGLFTGGPVTVRFRPSPPSTGVTFVRCDAASPVRIAARLENLTRRARRTSLKNGTLSVETVEHCLAAVRGLGIDNLEIELNNAELPGVDGSALPYAACLSAAGVVEQDAARTSYSVPETVRVVEGDAELVAWPGEPDRLDVYYELDYGAYQAVGHQICRFTLDEDGAFVEEIAPARTFVLEDEAKALRASGLGLHLSFQDVLVIGPNGPIENAYRFPDECVRHKVLDLIGDLMLMGCPIAGRVFARKSGHHLNQELVRRLQELRRREQLRDTLIGAPKLDIRQIQRILPHRYPMLLVDRVIELDGVRRAVAIKNISINEPYFQGHYPRQPIMPGVLLIEALAQVGGLLLSQKLEHTGKVAVLLSLDKVKFRRPVTPGDQLLLEAEAVRVRTSSGEVFCRAKVGDELACEATIRFMLVDADPG